MGQLLSLLKAPVTAEIITPESTEVTDPGNSLHLVAGGGHPVVARVVVVVRQGVEAGHALDLEDRAGTRVVGVGVGRGHYRVGLAEGPLDIGAAEGQPLAVVSIDIDNFKEVNDTSGTSVLCQAHGKLDWRPLIHFQSAINHPFLVYGQRHSNH